MKVAFWIHDEWAFGSIHKALCKEFYKRGIYADLVPWHRQFRYDEIQCLANTYDIWVSTPGPALDLLVDAWNISRDRIVLIAHAGWDIQQSIDSNTDLSGIKGYGVICNLLVGYSKERGIDRVPTVVQNGIMFDHFYRKPAESFNILGYIGKEAWPKENYYDYQGDWKRGYLAEIVAQNSQTRLRKPGYMSHLCMPGYYQVVDSVMVCSTDHEACGLPLMEGAAAGCLPMAANIGINADMENPTGIILPMDEKGFVEEAVEKIKELRANPELFTRKCVEAQEFAREYYDWSKVIDGWIDLIV